MTNEQSYFLKLLAAFLNRQTAPPPVDIDGEKLFLLAEGQGLSGVVGYMLQSHPDLPDAHTAALFSRRFYETVFLFSRMREQVDRWRERFNAAGIPYALLKGAVLQEWYPAPELRTYGDVDVFLERQYIPQLRELLASENREIIFENEEEIVVRELSQIVEFHFDLTMDAGTDSPQLLAYLGNTAVHMTAGKTEFERVLDADFHFIYLLSHQMHHFREGSAGVRTFMDLAVFLQSGQISDMQEIQKKLTAFGMDGYAAVALGLTARWFDVPSPFSEEMTAKDAAFAANYILSAGQFGFQQSREAVKVQKQMNHRFPRLSAVLVSLFPPKESLKKDGRYAALAQKSLLLAWLKRFFHAVCHRRQYIKATARGIWNATDTARERAHMLELLHVKNGG